LSALPPSRGLATFRVALVYGAAFALTFACSSALVILVGGWGAAGRPTMVDAETRHFARSAHGLLASAFVESVLLLGIAIAAVPRGEAPGAALRLGRSDAKRGGLATALGLVGLSAAAGAATELLQPHAPGVTETFVVAFQGAPPMTLVLAIVAIGIAPAIAEEVFFRGLLQGELAPLWGRGPAVVMTAACFAVFHLDVAQGTAAFLAGVLLGWVADHEGSIRSCIVAHAVNNILFVGLAVMTPSWASSPRVQPWVLGCGAVMLATAIALLRSAPHARRVVRPPLFEGAGGP
jgi:membrane protease YdiL (CAAX protease family)